ncbi:MAG: SGNH/GDSL hydrolase family protein [Clostridia bacterium]|nr:SGNH/GDSL hydrolase family protein [Clostridia bacterium]
MKKAISLILACISLLLLSVPAMAWTTPAVEVPQSNGMTYEQIYAELEGDAAYDWSGAVTVAGTNYGAYEGVGEFKITHAGDYLYIYTRMTPPYAYRTQVEKFIYVDLTQGDNKVDYIMITKPNYGPYVLDGTNISYYKEGVVDRARQNDEWGPGYNATVNKDSGLAAGILFGRNEYSNKNSEDAIFHIAVPLSEANKTALANGSCNIGVGFAYIQCKTAGAERYYTNCGEFTLDNADNVGNDFYDDITEDKLTTVTLKKGTNTTTPDNVIGSADIAEVTPEQIAAQMKAWVEADRSRAYDMALEDLTVNIIGDSYFAGHTMGNDYVWPKLLSDKYYWKFKNYGMNGGMVSSYAPTVDPTPMVDRYKGMADNDADLIIVDGGRNDYNNEVPLGTVDSTDPKTFMGALNVLIDGLQEKYPDAMIMFTTVWNFGGTNDIGLKSADYANAMISVCEAQGVYCFKANDPAVSGVDMTSETFRSQYCLTNTDVSHLNMNGMKLVMPKFEEFITASYADFVANKSTVPSVPSDTNAEETTAGDSDVETSGDVQATDTNSTDDAEGGCNSSIGGMAMVMAVVLIAAACFGKAKKTSEK